jgi:hypothetical protein
MHITTSCHLHPPPHLIRIVHTFILSTIILRILIILIYFITIILIPVFIQALVPTHKAPTMVLSNGARQHQAEKLSMCISRAAKSL